MSTGQAFINMAVILERWGEYRVNIVYRVSVIVLLGLLLVGMTASSASALYTTGPTSGSQDITMYGSPQSQGKMTPPVNASKAPNVTAKNDTAKNVTAKNVTPKNVTPKNDTIKNQTVLTAPYGSGYPAAGTGTPGYGFQDLLTGYNMPIGGMPSGNPAIGGYPSGYGASLALDVGGGPIPVPAAVPAVPVVSGGVTRTFTRNIAGGTFVPPQAEVTQSIYSHPGITPYGPYPGAGIASAFGVGFTPMGYGPYGGTIPL